MSHLPSDSELVVVAGQPYCFFEIRSVVEAFYTRVAVDDLLRVPFGSVQDWPHHIDRLTHFWWTRFGGRPYRNDTYNPVEKHFFAGFDRAFLHRWLQLFQETMEEKLSPEQAERWISLAQQMGNALAFKNELYRRNYAPLEQG